MNRKIAKLKIVTDGISEDEALEIILKAHRHKHKHGESCRYQNPLMDDLLEEMNGFYKQIISSAMSEVIKELWEDANIGQNIK